MTLHSALRIAVVIPTYRDTQEAAQTLDRLIAQRAPTDEIIVVDNGPIEEHPQVMDALGGCPGVRLLHCATRGSYAARNAGASATTADILAFTDAGCRVSPDWLAVIRTHFAHGGAPRVSGPIQIVHPGARATVFGLVDEKMHLHQNRYVREGWAATANLAVAAHIFQAVGGFNPDLRSGGDLEFGIRCAAAGHAIAWSERMSIDPAARTTRSDVLAKRRRVLLGTQTLHRDPVFQAQLAAVRTRMAATPLIPRRPEPSVSLWDRLLVTLAYRMVRLHDRRWRRRLEHTANAMAAEPPAESAPHLD